MPDEQLGVAFLGVTHPHTSGRTRAMLRADGVKVLGAADDDPVIEPFTRHLGVPLRTTEELLADGDVDAVIIHAKSHSMVPLAVRALEAGKAVLVEKPGGAGIDDLRELVRVERSTGGVCQVGYNYRFSPSVDVTNSALDEGWLGDVLQVRAHGGCSLDEAASSHLNQPDDIGGAFWVIGCHVVDLLLAHFGVPETVNARIPTFPGRGSSFREDAAAAVFSYPDRLVTVDFFSWDSMPWIESWQIELHGTAGSLYARTLPTGYDMFLSRPAGGHPAGWTRWRETGFPTPWAAQRTDYSPELAEIANTDFFDRERDAFLAAVRRTAPVVVTATAALDVARVIAACFASSARAGAEIPLA